MTKNNNQPSMFETEDLPLFSGTAPKAKESTFKPQTVEHQSKLLACPICLGTGTFLNIICGNIQTFCTCEIGRKAKFNTLKGA